LDVHDIRSHFPALEREHAGRPVAYFDGPGGTQVPRAVVDAMTEYMYGHNANRRWAYPSSAETDEAVATARAKMAVFLGCRPADVVFGPNMTALAYHLSRTLATVLRPGDEIVVTRLTLEETGSGSGVRRERGAVSDDRRIARHGRLRGGPGTED
jgi:selenocysteine lyase/cysteine desulfurase